MVRVRLNLTRERTMTPVHAHGGFAIVGSVGITLHVKRLRPEARLPARATEGASGLDLHACLPDGDITLSPDPQRVGTGGVSAKERKRSEAEYRSNQASSMACAEHDPA